MTNKNFTIKGLKENTTAEVANLINAVKNQLGCSSVAEFVETCENVCTPGSCGAAAGYSGFVYYSETVAFFRSHRKKIAELAQSQADSIGEDTISMVRGFNCLDSCWSYDEVSRAIYGRYSEDLTQIYNALAWFALEEVARAVEEYNYELNN